MKRTKRLGLVIFLAVILLPVTIWAAGTKEQATEPALSEKIIVADANSTHHLNLYVAYEKGYFTEKGLNVEVQQTSSGVAAVVGGEADIVFNCPTGVITPIATGQDITIIGQVKIPCTSVLVVPVNSDIKKPEDVLNRQIAGLSTTCCAVIAIRDTLKGTYDIDFELITLAPGAALAALEAKSVSGAILEEPYVAEALLLKDAQGNPKYKTIFDGHSDADGDGQIDANLAGEKPPCRTINANKKFVADRTEDVKKFIEAIDKANAYILKDPSADDVVAIAQKYVPNVSKQAIIDSNPKLGFTIHLDTEGLKGYADALVNQGRFPVNPGDGLFAPELKGITW